MSDEILTVSRSELKSVFVELLEEGNFASKDDLKEVDNKASAAIERVKNIENRIAPLEGLTVTVREVKEQNGKMFDLAQSTNNMVIENSRSTQRERERVNALDKRFDQQQDATNKKFDRIFSELKDFSVTLNDVEIRSLQTVESNKRMDTQLKNVIELAQQTHSMISQSLTYQAQVQAEIAQKDATREELFEWVRARKTFEEKAGKRIKQILEFLFKDRVRTGATLVVASVPVLKPVIELLQSVIGG